MTAMARTCGLSLWFAAHAAKISIDACLPWIRTLALLASEDPVGFLFGTAAAGNCARPKRWALSVLCQGLLSRCS